MRRSGKLLMMHTLTLTKAVAIEKTRSIRTTCTTFPGDLAKGRVYCREHAEHERHYHSAGLFLSKILDCLFPE